MDYTQEGIERFMRQAIGLAREAMQDGRGGPFGAVVVRQGEVVGTGANRVVHLHDPTAHAEVAAIRSACEALGTHSLAGCVMFSSCEPCPMCLGAIYWARLDRIYYAATRADAQDAGFDDSMILAELAKPLGQRRIPMIQTLHSEATAVISQWRTHPQRVPY